MLKAPAREFQRFFWLPILLLINTCSTAKDVSTYVADSQKQESKIAEMRSSGVDESTIKKQEEVNPPPLIRIPRARISPSSQVLAEDGVALNDSRQRLASAVDALRLLVEGARAEGAPASESAELRAAEEALAAATA